MRSLAVATPGNAASPTDRQRRTTGSASPGLTTNRAPAAATSSTWSGTSTVPAPTCMPGSAARRRLDSSPASVRKVISMTSIPPSSRASARGSRRVPGCVELEHHLAAAVGGDGQRGGRLVERGA
jgi:hypothetical protein